MGWLFSTRWRTKDELVRHLTEAQGCTHTLRDESGKTIGEVRGSMETLAHSVRGNHLWSVMEAKYPERPDLDVRFIALFLMACDRRNGDWGYKDLEESMGPNECDCPLKYLEMVPEPDHNYGWRERVRAWHAGKRDQAKRAKTIAPGQRWLLSDRYGGGSCEILAPTRPKGHWTARFKDGAVYRVRPSMLVREMGKKEVTIGEFLADGTPLADAMKAAEAAAGIAS